MTILSLPAAALAWLGRRGTSALAVSIFLGLSVPALSAYVKPYLGEMVFVLLLFSDLRTDPGRFIHTLKAPRLPILTTLWVMVAVPILFGSAYVLMGLRETLPDIYPILILQCAIAPITSSAAFAALMGLDVAFSLVALIACNAVTPVTTAVFSYWFIGTSLISPVALGVKLFFFFAGASAIAHLIRRVAGQAWIERQKEAIDGLSVVAIFFFAAAAMDGVPRHVMADPLFAIELFGLIIGLSLALIGLSILVFLRAGVDRGIAIGLLAALRNLGVVMATLGTSLPDAAWFYFAMVQFPIYLLPALLKPLANRFQRAA